MPRIFSLAFLLFVLGSPSFAQSDAMVELYGEGVHRYFCNDFSGADQVLSTVVDSGSQDPRAHYFRGLARERAGMGGDMDFETGARLEAEGKRVVDVGGALARIQGNLRSKIEKARRDARIQIQQQQLMMEQARALMQEASGAVVPAAPSNSGSATPFPTELVPASDIGMEPAAPTPEVSDATNPFGNEPATPPPPAEPATEAVDPFGTPAPADAPAADPFGTPAAGAGDNPFGV